MHCSVKTTVPSAFPVAWGHLCTHHFLGSVTISSHLLSGLPGPLCTSAHVPFSFPILSLCALEQGTCLGSSFCPELRCVCARCSDQGEHALVLQDGRYLAHCCEGTTGTGQRATFLSAPVPRARFLCILCRYSCSSQRELSVKPIGYKASSNTEKRIL